MLFVNAWYQLDPHKREHFRRIVIPRISASQWQLQVVGVITWCTLQVSETRVQNSLLLRHVNSDRFVNVYRLRWLVFMKLNVSSIALMKSIKISQDSFQSLDKRCLFYHRLIWNWSISSTCSSLDFLIQIHQKIKCLHMLLLIINWSVISSS